MVHLLNRMTLGYSDKCKSGLMKIDVLQIVNQHLLKDLTELGLWNDDMKHKLIAHNGSIQVCRVYVEQIVQVYSVMKTCFIFSVWLYLFILCA